MVNLWIITRHCIWEGKVQLVSVCAQVRSLLHLVFGHHKITLIHLLFFWDLYDHCRVSHAVCLERDFLGVHSRCPWMLSMTHVIHADRSPYSGVILIDLRFFCFMIFWILYILCRNGQLVDCRQAMLFEGGKVYAVCVCLCWGAVCTLHFIVTRSFWCLSDFFWSHLLDIECSKWFIWSETVFESIVGAL